MAEANATSRQRVGMILLALAELGAMLLAAFFAALSVMMFDAPGSEARADLWVTFWSTAAVPVALLAGAVCAIAGAVRYTRRRLVLALAIPGAAIAWLIVCYAMIA